MICQWLVLSQALLEVQSSFFNCFFFLSESIPTLFRGKLSKGLTIGYSSVGMISQVLVNEDLTNHFLQSHVFTCPTLYRFKLCILVTQQAFSLKIYGRHLDWKHMIGHLVPKNIM